MWQIECGQALRAQRGVRAMVSHTFSACSAWFAWNSHENIMSYWLMASRFGKDFDFPGKFGLLEQFGNIVCQQLGAHLTDLAGKASPAFAGSAR